MGPSDRRLRLVHNPVKLGPELKNTRLYVYSGNGTPVTKYPFNFSAWTSGSLAEQEVRSQSTRFVNNVRAAGGSSVTFSQHTGVHDWPYWRAEFANLLKWNPFGAPPVADAAALTNWTYATMAGHGNMWGLGFKFDKLPMRTATFTRDGQTLTATGSGTVTITPGAADADASGNGAGAACSITVTLPFSGPVPSC